MVSQATGLAASIVSACLASTAVACQPPLFASVTATQNGPVRATAVAFVNSLAMTGSFFGPYIVGYLQDVTNSFAGAYLILSFVLLAGALGYLRITESITATVSARVQVAGAR
jgi:hypothetical protein